MEWNSFWAVNESETYYIFDIQRATLFVIDMHRFSSNSHTFFPSFKLVLKHQTVWTDHIDIKFRKMYRIICMTLYKGFFNSLTKGFIATNSAEGRVGEKMTASKLYQSLCLYDGLYVRYLCVEIFSLFNVQKKTCWPGFLFTLVFKFSVVYVLHSNLKKLTAGEYSRASVLTSVN